MKNTAVPRLRFPEFREVGDWEVKALVNVLTEPVQSPIENPQKIELLTVKLHCNGIENSGKYPLVTEKGRPYYRRFNGEILIGKQNFHNGGIGIVMSENDGKICSNAISSYKVIEDDLYFVYYFISRPIYYLGIADLLGGTGQKETSSKIFLNLPIAIPSKAEQTKLATFLTTLDTLLAAETEKLRALQAHKKGLMQVLFPGEGEVVPRVRFGEFSGEWEERTLGELIEIKGRIGYRGYTVEDIVKEGEGAIALSPSNISGAGALSFEKSTYISWFKYNESPEIMLEVGQTLLVKTGSTYGKTALINKLPVKATINPQLVVLKPTKINSVFLFLIVSGDSVQKRIEQTVVGGAIPTLSQDSISKFAVLVPSKKEQEKIATTLTALDGVLTAQMEKLAALKMQKKGLMQQLFPNPNDAEK